MPKRFTITEKWQDPWLHSKSIKAKLLWVYLCDVCDVAGFWEIDLERASFDTGISRKTIIGAFEELIRGYEKKERHIWLRNFIKHQGNLPLNPNNPAHKGIIKVLEQRKSFSNNILFILEGKEVEAPLKELSSSISISKGKSISKGNKGSMRGKSQIYPSEQEVIDMGITLAISEKQSLIFYHHYNKKGWVDGNNIPLTDLRSALVSWRNKNYQFEKSQAKQKLFPIPGKHCSERGCGMPAVYKWSSNSGYDFWACSKHLPEKVKEKYQ